MKLGSPIVAMVWELWRVTRTEIAWKLALPIGGGLAALGLCAAFAPPGNADAYEDVRNIVAAFALILIVIPHLVAWPSVAKLGGARLGFPFYLQYTRPVRTAIVVGLPMAYLAAASSAIYLGSALLLRAASGHAFPLLPVAAWIGALTLIMLAGFWSIRNRNLQVLVMMFAILRSFVVVMRRLTAVELPNGFDWPPRLWPTLFDFPSTDYAWIALIAGGSFGVTVTSVTWQRRGDGLPATSWTPLSWLWQALVSAFRFPCPTSSATRAQVWFELRSRGLAVLTMGVALAMVNLLLFTVGGPIDAWINARQLMQCARGECFYVRPMAMLIAMASVPAVLAFAGNAFGVLARQGRSFASPFEATQPYGTGRLAVIKVLVQSVCVLAALTAVAASVWVPGSLLGAGEVFGEPLRSVQRAVAGVAGALTGYEQLALAVVGSIGVAMMVASRAAFSALWTRYSRRLNIAGTLVLLYGVVLVLLTLAAQRWNVPIGAIVRGTSWAAALAVLCTTLYLAWRIYAERLATLSQASGVVLLSAMFAAAWLTLLQAAGVSLAGMPVADAARMLSPALLPLTIGVLAPWSYSRIRHT